MNNKVSNILLFIFFVTFVCSKLQTEKTDEIFIYNTGV